MIFCYAHYIPFLISVRKVNQSVPQWEATSWMFGKYCRATNRWLCQNLAQVWSFGKQVVPQLSRCCGIPVHLHWTALIWCRTLQPCPFSHHSSPSVKVNIKFSCLRILKKQADLCGQANTRCNFHNIATTTWAPGQVNTDLLPCSYDHLRSCRSRLVVNNFQILKTQNIKDSALFDFALIVGWPEGHSVT